MKKQNSVQSYVSLSLNFFQHDTITIAKSLIGIILVHESKEGVTAGRIVETEAYLSNNDPACHAARGKNKKNEAMFDKAGTGYVYLIYGTNYCFNVVTEKAGVGEAVLIRALEPIKGIELMQKRRSPKEKMKELTNGPGKLCQAMGITKEHDKADLLSPPLYLAADSFHEVQTKDITTSTRIGISKGKDKLLRFYMTGNYYVSRLS